MTSQQVRKPYLCSACEQRFGRREARVLRECARRGRFTLRDHILKSPALPIPGLNASAHDLSVAYPEAVEWLGYFAASVLWRAAGTAWPTHYGRTTPIRLGPYAEQLRQYLLGTTLFPPDIALTVFMDLDPVPVPTLIFPYGDKHGGAYRYWFVVPGIRFAFFVGKNAPPENRRLSLTSEGPKLVIGERFSRSPFLPGVLGLVKKSPPVGRLRDRPTE